MSLKYTAIFCITNSNTPPLPKKKKKNSRNIFLSRHLNRKCQEISVTHELRWEYAEWKMKNRNCGKRYNIKKYGFGHLLPHPIFKHISKVMMMSTYFPQIAMTDLEPFMSISCWNFTDTNCSDIYLLDI